MRRLLPLFLLAVLATASRAATARLAPEDSTVWRHVTWRAPYRAWIDAQQWSPADSLARLELDRALAARPDSVTLGAKLLDAAETAIYANLAREPRTLALAQRALAIFERTPGRDSLALARALFVVGEVQRRRRLLDEAGTLFQRGLELRERHLPADDGDLAGALAMRSTVLLMQQKPGALPLLERAYAIRQRRYGANHWRTLQLLQNIAYARREAGDLEGVAAAFETAARGFESQFGAASTDAIRAWSNVGLAAKDLADFPRASAAFDRALAGLAQQADPDTVLLAQTIGAYAEMHLDIGDVAAARPLVEREYAAALRYFPPGDRDYANAQYKLARLLLQTGDFARGTALLDSAMVAEASRKADSTGLAPAVYNRARVLRATRDTAAVAWMQRAWKLWRPTGGAPDAYTVLVQADYAGTLCDAGRVAEALPLLRTALAWADSLYGPAHPQTLGVLAELARAQLATGDTGAVATALRLAAGRREQLHVSVEGFAERQALLWSSRSGLGLDPLLALAVEPDASPAVRTAALDALARVRGLVLDAMAERVGSTAPALAPLADSLARARQLLARELVREAGDPDDAGRAARDEAERLERALATAAPRLVGVRDTALAQALAAALGADEALVSYARWEDAGVGRAPHSHLAAFVLRHGAAPRVFDLGNASLVDARVEAWREAMRAGLGAGDGRAAEREAVRTGAALRERVWDPLAPALAGAARVRVVPDGSLALVDFGALPARSGGWLVEKGPLLARVSRERDVLRTAEPVRDEALLAVGGVDFDHAGESPAPVAAAFRGAPPACAAFHDARFAPLPGAADEARRVLGVWSASGRGRGALLGGAEASEAEFKARAPHATRIHLATHGFVLASGCGDEAGTRGIGGLAPSAKAANAPAVDLLSHPTATFTRIARGSPENPLRLAGLALAGANDRSRAAAGAEDGVLTAEEIASLDLSAARDVVLSACDTGLGELADGEGVLGLERAFRIAGAANLVISLWPVPDETTAAWMERYWRARLERGAEPAAAVRDADRARLAELRAKGAGTPPARWAGFVATGAGR